MDKQNPDGINHLTLKVMLDLRVCGTLLYTEAALEEQQE